MEDLLKYVRDAEFPYPHSVIHLFVGGSELHGAKVNETDDLDIYGVYIEPPELVLGLEGLPTLFGRRQEMNAAMDLTTSMSRSIR